MSNINTEFAESLGREFAEDLNSHPEEAQNWSSLEKGSDIPEMDYITLRDHYLYNEREQREINEIEQAYCDAFNAAFAG